MYALLFLLYSLTFAMHDECPGLCPVGHVTVHTDDGGYLDPYGRATVRADRGCAIDPNGGPCVRAFEDGGGAMDPNGVHADVGPRMDDNG
jgi:hypothetical protein